MCASVMEHRSLSVGFARFKDNNEDNNDDNNEVTNKDINKEQWG